MVRAVGAEPGQAHRAPLGHLARVDVPDRLAVVLGVGVVGFMHRQGHRVVVDGDVDGPAYGLLDACGGATPAGEVVHHQLAEVYAAL